MKHHTLLRDRQTSSPPCSSTSTSWLIRAFPFLRRWLVTLWMCALGLGLLPTPGAAQTSRPAIPPLLQRSLPRGPVRATAPPKIHDASQEIRETAHFVLRYPRDWRRWVKDVLRHAEADYAQICRQLGHCPKEKLQVRFAAAGQDYARAQPFPWHPPSYIAGLAYPNQGVMTLRLRGIDGRTDLRRTFQHELSHLLLAKAAHHKRLPLWFIEGLAMLQSNDFGTVDRLWLLARARISKRWPPLQRLQRSFPASLEDRRLAYAVSLDFLIYLRKQKPDFLPRLLRSLRRGVPFHKALPQTLGQPWSELLGGWKSQSRLRYGWFLLLTQEWILWTFALFLLIWGYVRLKRTRRQQLAQLAAESDADTDDDSPWYPPPYRNS